MSPPGSKKESALNDDPLAAIIVNGEKMRPQGAWGLLHEAFWNKPNCLGELGQIEELERWLVAVKTHYKTQLSNDSAVIDEGYHPPMIRTELQENKSGQEVPYDSFNCSNSLQDPASFEFYPTHHDFSEQCHFLYTRHTVDPNVDILYVRNEYIRAENYIHSSGSRVYIIQGSSGEGKSGFMRYLHLKLLQDQKAVFWCSEFSWYLFCSEGVYKLDPRDVDDFCTTEASKNVYFLADANTISTIPLIASTNQNFQPTLIFATSPKDDQLEKVLEQSFHNNHLTFIMNPWTLFEIELFTYVLRSQKPGFPPWSDIKARILDFGPLLHNLWPKEKQHRLILRPFNEERLDCCLDSIRSIHDFRTMTEGLQLKTRAGILDGRCLFLVCRPNWEADESGSGTSYEHMSVRFQSLRVVDRVLKWIDERDATDKHKLMRATWDVKGWGTSFAFVFHTAFINALLDKNFPQPFKTYPMNARSDRMNVKYAFHSGNGKDVSLYWQGRKRIIQHKIPPLKLGILYYESFPHGPSSPLRVADVIVADPGRCYALTMTRSGDDMISESGLEELIDGMPTEVKEIYLIFVLPVARALDFGLDSTVVNDRVKFAETKGKALEIFVAKQETFSMYNI